MRYTLWLISMVLAVGFWARPVDAALIVNAPTSLGLNRGLVGHWSFDGKDISGVHAYDASGNGNRGTLTGGPVRGAGKIGQALEFDGVNDYVSISNASNQVIPSGNAAFSLSHWFLAASLPNTTTKSFITNVAAGSGFRYGIATAAESYCSGVQDHRIFFWSTENGGTIQICSDTVISPRKWYHVVVTRLWPFFSKPDTRENGSQMRALLRGV